MNKEKSNFKSREEEKIDQLKEKKVQTVYLVSIIMFLVFLVILVISVRRNIEIAEQKKPSLITISLDKKDGYAKNSEIPVNYTLMPDHVDSTELQWHSSNEEIAAFGNDNVLKTLSVGQTTIYAELSGVKSNELNIVVSNFLEDINIDNIPKQIEVGKSIDLNIELLPPDSVNTTLKIESSDDKILSVRDRTVIAQNPGEVTLVIKDSFSNILRNYEIHIVPVANKTP